MIIDNSRIKKEISGGDVQVSDPVFQYLNYYFFYNLNEFSFVIKYFLFFIFISSIYFFLIINFILDSVLMELNCLQSLVEIL